MFDPFPHALLAACRALPPIASQATFQASLKNPDWMGEEESQVIQPNYQTAAFWQTNQDQEQSAIAAGQLMGFQ